MRILIVEDEKTISEVIAETLKKNKFLVDVCYDGRTGLDMHYQIFMIYKLLILCYLK